MNTPRDCEPSCPTLTSAARTVVDLAAHFDRLKQSAEELRSRFAASQRGYFTPSEDEQVRHLHVSYWQSRAALLELVESLRVELSSGPLTAQHRQAAFLVGYAAAVLLVDAARSLREMFHRSPVVRAKLNEPDAMFGIPEGSYDTVQKSLTRPVNAWHLFCATRQFRKLRRALGRLVEAEPHLAPVLEVVRRRGRRVRVPVGRYLLARLSVQAAQVMRGVREDAVGRGLYRLEELAGRMIADQYVRIGHRPAVPEPIAARLGRLLQPGDVFIVRKEHALTNYFLPGYWPHAALFIGDAAALQRMGLHEHEQVKPRWSRLCHSDDGEARRVVEAMKDGVHIRSLRSPLASDAVVVIRPKVAQRDVRGAISRALRHVGKPYDFDFDFTRADRLVCTEVVYRAYEGLGGIRFELTRRAGRFTLAAEDLVRLALERRGFEPVGLFAPAYHDDLLTGHDADDVLRRTLAV